MSTKIDHGPAVRAKSKLYPKRFKGKTPKTVRVLHVVQADWPAELADPSWKGVRAEPGIDYPAWTNSHGAVAAHLPGGKQLGLKPAEFEVTAWLEDDEVRP
jgi:hypothetical protein